MLKMQKKSIIIDLEDEFNNINLHTELGLIYSMKRIYNIEKIPFVILIDETAPAVGQDAAYPLMLLKRLHSPEIIFALIRLQIIVMEPYITMPGIIFRSRHIEDK